LKPGVARKAEGLDDMGRIMRRGDQVDVARALRLKLKEDFRKPRCADVLPGRPVGYLGVLAISAAQRAVAEEDRAAPGASADRGLLPEMEGRPRDAQLVCGAAYPPLPGVAVRAAAPRAQPARVKLLP